MSAMWYGKPRSFVDAIRRENAVALAFPELKNSVHLGSSESSDSSSREERYVLNLSNDSTYYADDEYLSSIIEFAGGSSASVVSSLVIPPHEGCSDVESVYTTSSSGTAKPPNLMNDDDARISLSLTYCGTTNPDEAALASPSMKALMSTDSFRLLFWEKILLAAVVLTVIFCCGITAIVIFQFRSSDSGFIAVPPQESPSTNFTVVPPVSSSNRERFNLIRKYVNGGGGNIFIDDPISGTPQYDALVWMADVDAPNILGDINSTVLAHSDDLLTHLTQRYALLVIFFAVIGPEHLTLGGWASITGARLPECLWPGVTCRIAHGTNAATVVVGLKLDPKVASVQGSLPTELGLLSNLGTLGPCEFALLR
jgi:hypothetical protein